MDRWNDKTIRIVDCYTVCLSFSRVDRTTCVCVRARARVCVVCEEAVRVCVCVCVRSECVCVRRSECVWCV